MEGRRTRQSAMSGSGTAKAKSGSTSYKSGVSVALKDIQSFRREMEVEIIDFQKTTPAMNREIRAYAQNDDLSSMGEVYGETKWVLVVETAVLHKQECALKAAIGLDLITGNRAITFNATMIEIQVLANSKVCTKTAKFKGKRYDFDNSSNGLSTLDHTDYFVKHSCISSGPGQTVNLRVKATVEFKVLFVGGTPASFFGDVFSMEELYRNKGEPLLKIFFAEGKWVAVHDDHLSLVNPVFKQLIEERAALNVLFLNAEDGLDGETLEIILDECYSRRTFRFAVAGKALLAARKFKLVSLEEDCLRSYLDGINAGNVVEALEFSRTHSIGGVNEKVIEVLTRSVKKDPIGVALEKLNKVAKFNVPGLKEKFAELLGAKLQSLDMEDAVDALKLFSGQGFAEIEKKLMERVSDPATTFPMEQAAEVLITSSQLTQPELKTMVIKRIAENLDEFFLAGGFRELKSEDGLQRLIEDEFRQQKSKKLKTG